MIVDIGDVDPNFLGDFPRNRILQAFALLDKSGQHRVLTRRPVPLAAEDKPVVTIMYQHDYGWIEAREMFGVAVRAGAFTHMASFAAARWAAADAAELVPRVPLDDRSCINK